MIGEQWLDGLKYRWLERRKGEQFGRYFPPAPAGEYISLDLETSSLDTKTAEILEIAAVPVRGNKVYPGEALILKVKPTGQLHPDSVPVHQIREKDLEQGVAPLEAIIELLTFVGRRPIIGYNIRFDQLILSRYCQQYLGFPLPNRVLELSQRYYRRKLNTQPDKVGDLRFDTLCRDLDIPILERHTARGDAITTALAWIKLEH
ncbi:3'-5' exonuclease [Parendozoicomonas haliclonae]|uniref:DNA polymerase III PolC-type n=1 Tax=Parendozoicomonas haliclonae TaxID=1960125 RepID=A0A1X7AP04_9GAMM|nr:3'-5' exonuclease [Parendozoicomonas haliclonae]SMA50034.1 DNA polymerase III PolC-type [Parendozoicomonas haliclonae]